MPKHTPFAVIVTSLIFCLHAFLYLHGSEGYRTLAIVLVRFSPRAFLLCKSNNVINETLFSFWPPWRILLSSIGYSLPSN